MAAEYACGQVLFTLRNSNLHYLINETHKSVNITIRKKLIDNNVSKVATNKDDSNKEIFKKIKMENGLLKQEVNDLKIKCANLEVDRDEVEISNDKLIKQANSFDDKLDLAYSDSRELKGLISEYEKKIIVKDENISEIQKKIHNLERSNEKMEKVKVDLDENIMMLENVIESRDQKIHDLEEEMKTLDDTFPSTFSTVCKNCENACNRKDNLKDHNINKHSKEKFSPKWKFQLSSVLIEGSCLINCDLCDYKANTKDNLVNHELDEHNFPCGNCLNIFRISETYESHICKHNCDLCLKILQGQYLLKCDECDYTVCDEGCMKNQMGMSHIFKCDYCDTKTEKVNHAVPCNQCGYKKEKLTLTTNEE